MARVWGMGRLAVAGTAVIALLGLAACDPPPPADFVVDSAGDQPDAAVGDGVCATTAGTCTLRAAVAEAGHAATSADWGIVSIADGIDPVLTSVVRADGVIIRGGGATIDGPNGSDSGGWALHVCGRGLRLEDLTITGAGTVGVASWPVGACRSARLELVRTHVTGNGDVGLELRSGLAVSMTDSSITANRGGGGWLSVSSLTVLGSTISSNLLTGISVESTGAVVVVSSTFDDNGRGGLIYEGPAATSTILASTFTANRGSSALSVGAGTSVVRWTTIADNRYGPRFGGGTRVEDSTISGNQSGTVAMSGVVEVVRSTLVGSDLDSFGPSYSYGILDFEASIVEGDGSPLCIPESVVQTSGWNLLSDGSCALAGPGDQVGSAALAPLADGGGPTQVRLPAPGTPGIDAIPAGTPGICPADQVDQQLVARPQGPGCDVGAVERPVI